MNYTYKPTDYEIKLIILYAVKSLRVEATYTVLDYVISSSANVNYFELERYIADLLENGNLSEMSSDSENIFSITPSGEETLEFFSHKIPGSILSRLSEKIESINHKEAIGNKVTADYFPINENEFSVKFTIEERGVAMLNLEMYVGSKERAKKVCGYLKNNTGDFYSEIAAIIDKGLQTKND